MHVFYTFLSNLPLESRYLLKKTHQNSLCSYIDLSIHTDSGNQLHFILCNDVVCLKQCWKYYKKNFTNFCSIAEASISLPMKRILLLQRIISSFNGWCYHVSYFSDEKNCRHRFKKYFYLIQKLNPGTLKNDTDIISIWIFIVQVIGV